MKYFLILGISFLFISCSKDNGSGTPTSTDSTCQIVSVKWVNGTDSLTTNLSYNSDGKLSKTVDGSGTMTTYTYNGNQIYITIDGSLPSYDTTTLNDFGYVEQFNLHSDPLIISSTFFYTLDTILSYAVFRSPLLVAIDTSTYRFTDGDMTTTVNGSTTDNYTYYTDKSEQPADLYIYNQIINQGALAINNKHLTKSNTTHSGSQEYSYIFDASGKIISVTNHYMGIQSGTIVYYFTYACHL